MKKFRPYLIWLGGLAVFFAAYFTLRQSRSLMDALCRSVLLPFEQFLGRICSKVPFSVAEVVLSVGICAAFFGLTWFLRTLPRRQRKGGAIARALLTVVCTVLTLWAGYSLLWGCFYQAETFSEKSGIVPVGGTVEELTALTAEFAAQLADCSDDVRRDAQGLFAEPRHEIYAGATACYPALYGEFPFLKIDPVRPKPVAWSRLFSAMEFTGFYFPFTGEANLNDDCPAAFLPATICHELAHCRGVASEQECNFLGILAAVRSASAAYRYSGYLLGYVYLGNALYAADYDAWRAIRDGMPEEVLRDLSYNNAYWARFEGPVGDTAQNVYDGFLKVNGEELGMRSYGTVVDMLLAYKKQFLPIGKELFLFY